MSAKLEMGRKGQITIFVILGLLLVALSLAFISMRNEREPTTGGKQEPNLNSFFQSCLEEKIRKTVYTISEQGGYINSKLNKTFKFEGETDFHDIAYLCYNHNYYSACINQEPMFLQHLKKEIETNIAEDVSICFGEAASSLERKGEVVEAKYNGFNVQLAPRKIIVNVSGEITSTKSGQTAIEKDITGIFPSRLYELAIVVQEITSQEARFCNFENLGFMLFYPQYDIDKFRTEDSAIIYTVGYKGGNDRFRFAIKGCVIPPGL